MGNNIFIPKAIEFERAILKNSLFEFIKKFWNVVSEEKLVVNWHIEKISEELEIVNPCELEKTTKAHADIVYAKKEEYYRLPN